MLATWAAALLVASALACGGGTQQEIVVGPGETTRCQMSLATPPSLPAAGAQVVAPLATARDCTWTAHATASWLAVTPATGQGEATLTLTASVNPQGRTRSATIDINEQHFTVTQNGQPCRFEVAPTAATVPHQGGRVMVHVTTLDGCSWTTQSSQPWLRVVSGSGGEASADVELTIDSNSGPDRSATLTIATERVTVNQAAGPDNSGECRYSIGPGGLTIPAAGGNASFRVATMPQCAWGASSSQPWITIVTGNGVGPAQVQYRVDANTSTSNRSGVITVATRRHVVQQQAAPRP